MNLLRRLRSREVMTFLTVGGCGYVVDVGAFNTLLSLGPAAGHDPVQARTLAVVVATLVTYAGNRWFTWRRDSREGRVREMALFGVFNVGGLLISVACLGFSHDLLGLTSRVEDNLSANVVGIALGMVFRFWTYRRFVFGAASVVAADGGLEPASVPLHTGGGLRPLVLARADSGTLRR